MWRRCLSSLVRESVSYDVVVVGAGPAGLATAIRLKQRAPELEVCVVEKGSEPGAHILSGNVFDPKALTELFPDWKEKGAPLDTPVSEDKFVFLTQSLGIPLPVPQGISNHGNFVISLGGLVKWMASEAETLGVDIFSGFAADSFSFDSESGSVVGIITNDLGIGKDGKPKDSFQLGMEIKGRQTILAEGARGSLSESAMEQFDLRRDCCPQTYGLGFKEVWEVPEEKFKSGTVMHSLGWPLDSKTYGGGFLYHMNPNLVLVGFVIGLDYKNPYLNLYEEFQRYKTHPSIRSHLEGGRCISYGARVINEGGFQSVPKLTFPGGMLVGCSAGFVNVPRIKGSHTAIKSGMLAADSIVETIESRGSKEALDNLEVSAYESNLKNSWIYSELKGVRNVRPAFDRGVLFGLGYSGLELLLLKGREPWTFKHSQADVAATEKAAKHKPIEYPKPDGVLTFDILTNLQRSGTNHNHDQPAHLKVKEQFGGVADKISYAEYGGPEQRFCPAKVYEYVEDETGTPRLQINAQNCLHCKTCDIKTPMNYIKWTVPEGGGGPA